MAIEVELPDGSVVEFPDGTPNAVMEGALKQHAQATWKPQQRSPADLRQHADFYRAGHNEAAGDNSFLDNMVQSAGKSLADTGRSFKQLGAMGMDAIAPRHATLADLAAGHGPVSRADEVTADVDRARALDQDLMGTVGGNIGNIGGTTLQLVSPGAVLKAGARAANVAPWAAELMNTASRALLPTTIRGGIAQGATVGALQQTGSGDSRGLNALMGAGAGGLGAAIPKAVGGLVRLARGLPVREGGTTQRVAEILRSEAENPQGLMTQQPSLNQGVQRTLAEETLDPGIARLERYARGTGNGFDPLDRANNAARVQALGQFAGDPAAIKAAKGARDAVATPLRNRAMQDGGVDIAPVQQAIDQTIAKNKTRALVGDTLRLVQNSLAESDGSVHSLYGVRKTIDDLLTGRAGSEKSFAKAASKELLDVKGVLDQQIAAKSPAFAQYLAAYKGGSQAVDRMRVGQRLIRAGSGSSVPDAKTGLRNLTPAAFSNATSDLDALAARATGFRKAQAGDYLQPQDMATIAAVQDDLSRVGFASTAGSGRGSPTQPLLHLQDRMAGGVASKVASRIPGLGMAMQYLEDVGQRRLQSRLTEVLADPAQARAVLARVPEHDRRVLEKAFTSAGITLTPAIGQRLTK